MSTDESRETELRVLWCKLHERRDGRSIGLESVLYDAVEFNDGELLDTFLTSYRDEIDDESWTRALRIAGSDRFSDRAIEVLLKHRPRINHVPILWKLVEPIYDTDLDAMCTLALRCHDQYNWRPASGAPRQEELLFTYFCCADRVDDAQRLLPNVRPAYADYRTLLLVCVFGACKALQWFLSMDDNISVPTMDPGCLLGATRAAVRNSRIDVLRLLLQGDHKHVGRFVAVVGTRREDLFSDAAWTDDTDCVTFLLEVMLTQCTITNDRLSASVVRHMCDLLSYNRQDTVRCMLAVDGRVDLGASYARVMQEAIEWRAIPIQYELMRCVTVREAFLSIRLEHINWTLLEDTHIFRTGWWLFISGRYHEDLRIQTAIFHKLTEIGQFDLMFESVSRHVECASLRCVRQVHAYMKQFDGVDLSDADDHTTMSRIDYNIAARIAAELFCAQHEYVHPRFVFSFREFHHITWLVHSRRQFSYWEFTQTF